MSWVKREQSARKRGYLTLAFVSGKAATLGQQRHSGINGEFRTVTVIWVRREKNARNKTLKSPFSTHGTIYGTHCSRET